MTQPMKGDDYTSQLARGAEDVQPVGGQLAPELLRLFCGVWGACFVLHQRNATFTSLSVSTIW